MKFKCTFSFIKRWFTKPATSNPLEKNIKTLYCWSNTIETENERKVKIRIASLILFDLPELKFNTGNFGYFVFVTIKNEDVIIMGNNKRGSEYSGAITLTFSTYNINRWLYWFNKKWNIF